MSCQRSCLSWHTCGRMDAGYGERKKYEAKRAALSITKVDWGWRHSTASRVPSNRYRRIIVYIYVRFKRLPSVYVATKDSTLSLDKQKYLVKSLRVIRDDQEARHFPIMSKISTIIARSRAKILSENTSRVNFVRHRTIALRFSLAFHHVFARLKRAFVRLRVISR